MNHSNRCLTFKPVLGVLNLFLSLSFSYFDSGLKVVITGCQCDQKSGVSDQILRTGPQLVTSGRLTFSSVNLLTSKENGITHSICCGASVAAVYNLNIKER